MDARRRRGDARGRLACGAAGRPSRPTRQRRVQVDPYVARPRVVVLTDIANEPDDQMSMVRFLVYSNQFDVEGLVATTSTWMKNKVRPDVIHTVLDAYEQVQPNLLKHAPGFPTAAALRSARGRRASRRTAWPPSARGKTSPGAELIVKAALASRPAAALGARLGRHQHARAGAHGRARPRGRRRSSRRSSRSCASTRSPTRTTPAPGSGASSRRCTTSRCRRRQDGEEYASATWTGISGDRFYKNAPGADFTTFTDEWVNANIRSQGAARQALSLSLLHPRGRHAVVPRPDRQRPRERHEPGLRRLGRPLRLAAAVGRAAPVLDAGRRLLPGPRQLAGHRRRHRRAARYTSDQATIWRWRTRVPERLRRAHGLDDQGREASAEPQPAGGGERPGRARSRS